MSSAVREHWKLVTLGLTLVVAVGAIVTGLLSDRSPVENAPRADIEHDVIDTPLGDPPQHAWTLDVGRLTDNPGDVLLQMPYQLDSHYGYGGLLDAGGILIAATAYPLPEVAGQSGRPVGAITLVGVRPADGSPAWKTRVGDVSQCTQKVEAPVIACWERRRIAFVDTTSGTLLAELGTDFDLNGAQVVGDTVYVSGSVTDGASAKPVLTSGTVTNLTANFRRTFDDLGENASVYAVPATGAIITQERGPGDPQYVYTVFDLASGAERFTFAGDSLQPVGDGLYLAARGARSGSVGTQDLLAADGSLVRAVPIPAYSPQMYPSKPSVTPPMFLGDGAYDPATGDELWRSSALVKEESAGRDTALAAVVGGTAVVTSPVSKTITGLDLASGDQLWQTPWEDAYWIRGGATDGEYFVFGDYTGTHSIRASDGTIMWSLPLPDGVDPRQVHVSGAAGSLMVSWLDHIAIWR
ncbi:outer membrane protein assembly factor BamB family protein [Rhodococcus sp. NPDC003348]